MYLSDEDVIRISKEITPFIQGENPKITNKVIEELIWWNSQYGYDLSIVNGKIKAVDLQDSDNEDDFYSTEEFIEDWFETINDKIDAHGEKSEESIEWRKEIDNWKSLI